MQLVRFKQLRCESSGVVCIIETGLQPIVYKQTIHPAFTIRGTEHRQGSTQNALRIVQCHSFLFMHISVIIIIILAK